MDSGPVYRHRPTPQPLVVEEVESTYLLQAGAVGLVAAILAGVAWGLLARWTHRELGVVAAGVGLVVGAAVVRASGRTRSGQLQALAIVLALVGVVLGKYLAFVWIVDDVFDEFGLPINVSALSSDSVHAFWVARDALWDRYDLLWAGLASFAAWHVASPSRAS